MLHQHTTIMLHLRTIIMSTTPRHRLRHQPHNVRNDSLCKFLVNFNLGTYTQICQSICKYTYSVENVYLGKLTFLKARVVQLPITTTMRGKKVWVLDYLACGSRQSLCLPQSEINVCFYLIVSALTKRLYASSHVVPKYISKKWYQDNRAWMPYIFPFATYPTKRNQQWQKQENLDTVLLLVYEN